MFSKIILHWYRENKRNFPWRQTIDPYTVWVSEVILQQTRALQGLPYFEDFISNFPTLEVLAGSSEESVLKVWQGLGYYNRARNLHQTSKFIANQLKGKFPSTYDDLIGLKGIGDYTACAILSICFNQPYAVVDGNVYRVLSRYFGIQTLIGDLKSHREFKQLATELLDKKRPSDFNQGLMDFGSLQCTPKSPNCDSCVLKTSCYAYKHKYSDTLPKFLPKKATINRSFNYLLIIDSRSNIVIRKRTSKDIWRHLYDFPLVETSKPNILFKSICKKLSSEYNLSPEMFVHQKWNKKPIIQKLSHQKLFITFWIIQLKHVILEDVVPIDQLDRFPFPVVLSKFLKTERDFLLNL